jgi:hypothetical protein
MIWVIVPVIAFAFTIGGGVLFLKKGWPFFPLLEIGLLAFTFIIFGVAGQLISLPNIPAYIALATWSIPFIFLIVANVGAIKAKKRELREGGDN